MPINHTYLKLTLAAIFWGGTFIAGRAIAQDVSPYSAAFLRFAMAAVGLGLLVRSSHGTIPRLTTRQIPLILVLGLTGVFLYNILFFTGLRYIEAGRAALIIAGNPVAISCFSALFLKEPLRPIQIAGIFLSVCGAVIIISKGQLALLWTGGFGIGEWLILGCVASWVAYSLFGKLALKELEPLVAVFYSAVAGSILLLPMALKNGIIYEIGFYGTKIWAALVYLAVLGTVFGFWWYYEGIRDLGASRAGVFINLVPVSAVILAYFLLGEPITLAMMGGGFMVLGGVFLTNYAAQPTRQGNLSHMDLGKRP